METNTTQETQQPNNEHTTTTSDELLNQLPKDTRLGVEMVQYQGSWVWSFRLQPILSFQTHFQAESTDIFITGMPKTGHTWLKSLVFSILYRHHEPISSSPLLDQNSHSLIPHLEVGPYADDPSPDLSKVVKYQGSPRLLSTHLTYQSLPQSIKDLKCRIIYICRSPLDTFVSSYFFTKGIMEMMGNVNFPTLEEYFELYLQGITSYGPFFDHVLGYWKARVEMPNKFLCTAKSINQGRDQEFHG